MPITPPIRLFIVFALLAALGFAFAAWIAGAPVAVLVGVAGSFAAAVAVIAEIDRDHQPQAADPWQMTR